MGDLSIVFVGGCCFPGFMSGLMVMADIDCGCCLHYLIFWKLSVSDCGSRASALVGTHMTVVQVLALRSCFWGPGNLGD